MEKQVWKGSNRLFSATRSFCGGPGKKGANSELEFNLLTSSTASITSTGCYATQNPQISHPPFPNSSVGKKSK